MSPYLDGVHLSEQTIEAIRARHWAKAWKQIAKDTQLCAEVLARWRDLEREKTARLQARVEELEGLLGTVGDIVADASTKVEGDGAFLIAKLAGKLKDVARRATLSRTEPKP